jgi:hypothetical protein
MHPLLMFALAFLAMALGSLALALRVDRRESAPGAGGQGTGASC